VQSFNEPFAPLSDLERRRSCAAGLAAAPEGLTEFWIFGYGSLMWDATFPYAQSKPARLLGWRREMCIWTALARGTPAFPGLSLGLMPGGVCEGVAYELAGSRRDQALEMIWQREMWTDIYTATWVTLEIEGRLLPALTFTTNQASRQFVGDLALEDVVEHIAKAEGERGPCRDYLSNTVARMRSLGIDEPHLHALNDVVKTRV
jgi:cation transport protein ChaC